MTDENKKEIEELKKFINNAEDSLESAKRALADLTGQDISEYKSSKPSKNLKELKITENGKVIEGIFNGENMVGPEGKVFPVPANYASKSKMVEGDKLKLTVAEDGSFIFKQIGPVDRTNLIGTLVFEDNMYQVLADGKRFNLLYASVTYHKAKPGDRVTIVIPKDGNAEWAALENIIHDDLPTQETAAKQPMKVPDEIDTTIFDTGKPLEPEENIAVEPEQTQNKEVSTETLQPEKSQLEVEQNQDTVIKEDNIFNKTPTMQPETTAIPQIQAETTAPEGNLGTDHRTGLPEESFLPRSQDETTNSLGESPPTASTADNPEGATELEI